MQALNTQATQKKEVVGYVTTNGFVINFDTFTSLSSDHDFSLSFPLYDSQICMVTSGPYQDNDGTWKIDINNWINGSYDRDTYVIAYGFHTHPLGKDADGNLYKPNIPSASDLRNASVWSGFPQHIVNANNEVIYNSTGIISTSPNHCL